MEFTRLDANTYTNPVNFEHDSSGILDLTTPHVLWTSNCVASSQLWPIEFVAAKTRVFIIDISNRGAGKLKDTFDLIDTPPGITANNPWWNTSPRGITFLRIGTLANREVLLATTDNGEVIIWRTLALYRGDKMPWFEYKCEESAWGIDVHPNALQVVVSDNSGKVTLLTLSPTLEVIKSVQSENLGGNIPSVCFVGNYVAYTMLTLDLMVGSFGLLDQELGQVYSIKMQQAGWCIKPLGNSFMTVHSALDLCGSDCMPQEFQSIECRDVCDASYVLNVEGDRLGLRQRWVEPQTWVKEQQSEMKEWIKHGRRKTLHNSLKDLDDQFLFVTTSTHGFLVQASSGQCLASAEKALLPPGILPSEEFCGLAISIVEVIEPINVAILVSRTATVIAVRFTERHNVKSFRQETVLCDFPDFIVGISSCPARAHDFEYELRNINLSAEASWSRDVKDKSLGDVGTYLVRLHTKDGKVEAFLVSA